ARRGLPDGLCENSHHRKTSTLTPTPTRRPRSHHSYTLICEEPENLNMFFAQFFMAVPKPT
ncbi:hypothetical protein, partial [Kocuria sp. HSID16901]|uniref:hypothetical protein n=1 Tax=Kocuria sp. HSID16901 TaxID=2419505 RepID=UPI001EE890BA